MFSPCVFEKLLETDYDSCCYEKITRYLPFDAQEAFCVQQKILSFNFSTLLPKNLKIPAYGCITLQ